MHDAEMNATDWNRIVVDEPEQPFAELRVEGDLFVKFPVHAVAVRIAWAGGIVGADVSADAERAFGRQPLLAATRAAAIVEQHPAAAEQNIRDELLERGIGFDLGTRP